MDSPGFKMAMCELVDRFVGQWARGGIRELPPACEICGKPGKGHAWANQDTLYIHCDQAAHERYYSHFEEK